MNILDLLAEGEWFHFSHSPSGGRSGNGWGNNWSWYGTWSDVGLLKAVTDDGWLIFDHVRRRHDETNHEGPTFLFDVGDNFAVRLGALTDVQRVRDRYGDKFKPWA